MAVRLLERVPIDRIEQQAKPVDLGRLLPVLLVGFFYLIGFVARKAIIVVGVGLGWMGVGLGWMVAATRTGWQDAGLPVEERRRGVA
ncbi:MAG TPA: hypothetical protein VGJ95_08055 [Pseudonocardiaceae bacterium]|jgi:hypothetical protein